MIRQNAAAGPPPPHVVNDERYKTVMCRNWELHGVCKFGSKCHFAHGPDEIKTRRRGGGGRNGVSDDEYFKQQED